MQGANSTLTLRSRSARLLLVVLGGGLLVCGVLACSAGLPSKPGALATSARDKPVEGGHEARLQALEAGMKQLAMQIESLQAASTHARSAGHMADIRPAGLTPIRPGIVLAAHPIDRAPTPPAAAHVPAPGVVPEVAPEKTPAPPQHRPGQGDWVINLASYSSESFAKNKQVEFIDKGVAVEQVQAQVKGKTVYRLRVPGFESLSAAGAEADAIRARLGLDDTWIARR
ncbi:MAG: SPOR domain-containing protein [Gammaproteobacteria bacterium]